MDILYVIGPGSRNNNLELRLSLRSLEKFGMNLGKIVVCGYPPNWLSKEVVKVPLHDPIGTTLCKFRLIERKIFHAIDSGAVKGEFLLTADDCFLTQPVDLDNYPFYWRRKTLASDAEQEDLAKNGRGGINYRHSLCNTRQTLEAHDYPIVDYEGHCLARLDTQDTQTVKKLMKGSTAKWKELGFSVGTMFINVRATRELNFVAEHSEYRKDNKIHQFDLEAISSGQFSTTDSALSNPELMQFFKATYPFKSRFEQ